MVTVDNGAAATVIGLWWGLSLLFVLALLELQFVAPLLAAVRRAVPAVQQYAQASGFAAETTAFYCFFLLSSPFAAVYYFRFIALKRPLKRGIQLILWALIPLSVFSMTIGMDLGPRDSRGFLSLFNTVLTSSWFGSSFIFLLFCHCALSAIVCIAKDKGRRFS
jgi:hypothetical protein